jgi:hypothetical protein
MSSRVTDFVSAWIAQNVRPIKYEAEDDDSESEAYARACIAAAGAEGISKAEIHAVYRDLGPHISGVIDTIIEARIERDST